MDHFEVDTAEWERGALADFLMVAWEQSTNPINLVHYWLINAYNWEGLNTNSSFPQTTVLETFASRTLTRTKWLTGLTTVQRTRRLPWQTSGHIRRWYWTPRATPKLTPTGLFWTRFALQQNRLKLWGGGCVFFNNGCLWVKYPCHWNWMNLHRDFFVYHSKNCIFRTEFTINWIAHFSLSLANIF